MKKGNNYLGTVPHFSNWNDDTGLPGITFSATFQTQANLPLEYTKVIIKPSGSSYGGYAHGYTDSIGQVSGLIPSGVSLVLGV